MWRMRHEVGGLTRDTENGGGNERNVCGGRSTGAVVSSEIGKIPANFGWNLKTSVMSVEFHYGMLVSAWIFVCSPVAPATLFKKCRNFLHPAAV